MKKLKEATDVQQEDYLLLESCKHNTRIGSIIKIHSSIPVKGTLSDSPFMILRRLYRTLFHKYW